ncbi:Peptide-N(4)-(N-acetyl-beta-glucosaminyl)asparagine amidase [Hypsibius exemplaris]|uniref:Peptide-N(4)-(N-acetyl-beta-glucosaminyl)asparagine amidase n=1 Tax=Hypsibius exemplaris TaxID=2072580 RepID=A0A1W0WKB4_HYPEX|nr:Peptide-N(4)-(N-acetyl-beta-glucosaminyl)asparagine amidase [Hypsibius exemplaris]
MDSPALQSLLKSDAEAARKSIVRILDNILRTQQEADSKFRRINISSETFVENVISVEGGLDLLFEIGFQEDTTSNEHLVFPFGHPIAKLEAARNQLARAVGATKLPLEGTSSEEAQSSNQSTAAAGEPASSQLINQPLATLHSQSSNQPTKVGDQFCAVPNAASVVRTAPFRVHSGERRTVESEEQKKFRHMIATFSKEVLQYENEALQTKIRNVVPVSRLRTTALELAQRSDEFPGAAAVKQEAITSSCFLFLLLKWFKDDFFQWVNQPKCDNCGGETVPLQLNHTNQRLRHPTTEEARYRAGHVEVYQCTNCKAVVRFPRYNDPMKLLDTRRGRCGEWANCFTAICRAVGFDARYVQDSADHVWTEVFSVLENRWLHCDACETALDRPLTYEVGWGKKLAYVMAFSRDEVIDVSWRYSADHQALRSRRTHFSEKWLMNVIAKFSGGLQSRLSNDRKSILQKRRVNELVEFLTPRSVQDSDKAGRSSGSLTWRLSRGEIGLSQSQAADEPFVIVPKPEEYSSKRLKICYDASSDTSRRGAELKQGFKAYAFKSTNIIRKVESDWRMAYLARQPATSQAELSWKVQCNAPGTIKKLNLRAPRAEFESGQVRFSVTVDGQTDASVPEYYVRNFSPSDHNPNAQDTRSFFIYSTWQVHGFLTLFQEELHRWLTRLCLYCKRVDSRRQRTFRPDWTPGHHVPSEIVVNAQLQIRKSATEVEDRTPLSMESFEMESIIGMF